MGDHRADEYLDEQYRIEEYARELRDVERREALAKDRRDRGHFGIGLTYGAFTDEPNAASPVEPQEHSY